MSARLQSSAVMQQRVEPHDSLDYFPTPPWATRALCEWIGKSHDLAHMSVWEPACGEGYMVRPLAEFFKTVRATDVADYSATFPEQDGIEDFLLEWPTDAPSPAADWIITNPPFNRAAEFVELALRRARIGVAVFVRTSFLEGGRRYRELWSRHWPTLILQFAERVPVVKGRVDPEASSATSFCWVIWEREKRDAPRINWIAPCRRRLEKIGDYRPSPRAEVEPGPLVSIMEGTNVGS